MPQTGVTEPADGAQSSPVLLAALEGRPTFVSAAEQCFM